MIPSFDLITQHHQPSSDCFPQACLLVADQWPGMPHKTRPWSTCYLMDLWVSHGSAGSGCHALVSNSIQMSRHAPIANHFLWQSCRPGGLFRTQPQPSPTPSWLPQACPATDQMPASILVCPFPALGKGWPCRHQTPPLHWPLGNAQRQLGQNRVICPPNPFFHLVQGLISSGRCLQ